VTRLDLIRTLREPGLDLATIRTLLEHETALSDVAAAPAEALTVQLRTLQLRRAILTMVAERHSTPEDLNLIHRLSKLSAAQPRRTPDGRRLPSRCPPPRSGRRHPRPGPPPLDAGVAPGSPDARPFITAALTRYAEALGVPDSAELRHRLAGVLETANDPRWARYLHLLAITNGWEPQPPLTPTYSWDHRALRATTAGAAERSNLGG
jgi:hypothetical protein